MLLLHALAFAHGGLPLIYMGDELGLLNDAVVLDDPARRDDNRWMHRPAMDWEAAERRHDPGRSRAGCGPGLQRLIAARRATRAIHVQGVVEPIWTGNDHVFGLCREQAGERLLVLGELHRRRRSPWLCGRPRARTSRLTEAAADVDGRPLERYRDFIVLAPYQHLWLSG